MVARIQGRTSLPLPAAATGIEVAEALRLLKLAIQWPPDEPSLDRLRDYADKLHRQYAEPG
jgi:hypothetical protein